MEFKRHCAHLIVIHPTRAASGLHKCGRMDVDITIKLPVVYQVVSIPKIDGTFGRDQSIEPSSYRVAGDRRC